MKTSNCAEGIGENQTGATAVEADNSTVLGRLIGLMRENERLFVQQRLTRERLIEARLYQLSPQNNPILASALIDRLRQRHFGLMAVLRSNRIEAHALLARLEGAERP